MLRKMSQAEFEKNSIISYENYVADLFVATRKSRADLAKEIGPPPSQMNESNLWFIVEADGQDVGFLWLRIDLEKSKAYGMDLWVDYGVRNQGIGRAAIRKAGEKLKSLGVKTVAISFFDSNNRAKQIYTSFGFSIDEKIHPSYQTRTAEIVV
jgi:GNAT superfamily N-acetyltransferase